MMTDLKTVRKRHYPGCYRISSLASDVFGQIKQDGRMWNAEIRDRKTGDMRRFAGIWYTLKDAQQECESIMRRHPVI
jgi:hypothetical protein